MNWWANSASKEILGGQKLCIPQFAGKTDLEESVSTLAVAMDIHRRDS